MRINQDDKEPSLPEFEPLGPEIRERIREGAALAADMLRRLDRNSRFIAWTALVKHFGERSNVADMVAPMMGKMLPGLAEAMELEATQARLFSALAILQAAAVLDEIEAAEKAK